MEVLHSLVVTALVASSLLSSNSNVEKVLGVKVAQDRTNTETSVETNISEVRQTYELRREELLKKRQEVRSDFEERVAKYKEEVEQKREELKLRLESLRDERKAKITQNIVERITKVNEKWVNQWDKVLDRLEEILAKLETRLTEYTGDADISSLQTSIDEAQAGIETARAAVEVQSVKVYEFNFESEETLGQDIRTLLGGFKEDIEVVWQTVKETREKVHNVFVEVRKLTNQSNKSEIDE